MYLEKINNKLLSIDKLLFSVSLLKKSHKKIVFTNGCFDILHAGHLKLLKHAKRYGDVLIVGVNSDESVKLSKGTKRPIISQEDRLVILASLKIVDFVIIFEEKTPLNLIKKISPDILVKGGDYKINDIIGADYLVQKGGEVKTVKLKGGCSTSSLIKNL